MPKMLDRFEEESIADEVVSLLNDLGYDPEFEIPGLILAIRRRAKETMVPELVVDEAIDLLSEEEE